MNQHMRLNPSITALTALTLAVGLWASACSGPPEGRLPREPEAVDAPPPLLPAREGEVLLPEPSPFGRPQPLPALPPTELGSPQPVAPQGWPQDEPLAASQPTQPAGAENLIEATGYLAPGGKLSGWHFVFHPERPLEGLESAEILPGNLLERMAQVAGDGGASQNAPDGAAQADGRVLFHITAEVTRYKQRHYLVIRRAQYAASAVGSAEGRP